MNTCIRKPRSKINNLFFHFKKHEIEEHYKAKAIRRNGK